MRKYVLENTTCIKEADLSVTEYLSKSALQERKTLNRAVEEARQNGHFAVIRNSKQFVDSKNVKEKIQPQEKYQNKDSPKINDFKKNVETF